MSTSYTKGKKIMSQVIEVRLNVFARLKELELKKGRSYQYAEIVSLTGLNRHTVKSLFDNKATRIDLATMRAVLNFFHGEGMPIGPGDLFTVTD